MQSPRLQTQILPPPPGIIGSLRTGFDTIATHISVILMPLALDLLLWLGPHLSLYQIIQPVLKDFGSLASGGGLKVDDVQSALDMYRNFFHAFNLFDILRTFPIGISSLMSGSMPTQSPLGIPTTLQIDSPNLLLALLFLLTIAGWILGGLYFHWVATLVTSETAAVSMASAGRAVLQTLLYSTIWSLVCWTIGLPLVLVMYILFSINTLLGEGVLLFLGFLSMWLIVPIFFSAYGIFVSKQNAFASILGGFRMTRFTLPNSSLFVLTVILLGVGLNFLWSVPANNTWMALVGILGHAFITTALLAASFVYYHDMTAWLQTALEHLRAGLPTQQA
jgi:hypothetical protein